MGATARLEVIRLHCARTTTSTLLFNGWRLAVLAAAAGLARSSARVTDCTNVLHNLGLLAPHERSFPASVVLRGGGSSANFNADGTQIVDAYPKGADRSVRSQAAGEGRAQNPTGLLDTMEVREPLRKADPSAPPVTRQDVLACQIGEWYPAFSKHTLKTKFIELSPEFVEYILADGLVLPVGCEAPSAHTRGDGDDDSWSDFTGSESENEGNGSDADGNCDDGGQPTKPKFDAIVDSMNKAIEELGGEAFPKLMWSCPRDATWINAGENIRCVSAADVIMLLKSSDFVVHDLCHPFDCCADGGGERDGQGAGVGDCDAQGVDARGGVERASPGLGSGAESTAEDASRAAEAEAEAWRRPRKVVLALRKWFDGLRTCMEFRCFVRDEQLVGISQRDCTQAFDFLMDSKRQIIDVLSQFHSGSVR